MDADEEGGILVDIFDAVWWSREGERRFILQTEGRVDHNVHRLVWIMEGFLGFPKLDRVSTSLKLKWVWDVPLEWLTQHGDGCRGQETSRVRVPSCCYLEALGAGSFRNQL